jgi:hypothetical protein
MTVVSKDLLWLKAIIINKAFSLEPYHTIPDKNDIIARYQANGNYIYAMVRGHKPTQNKLMIKKINFYIESPATMPILHNGTYIDFLNENNNVICQYNFKLKPKLYEDFNQNTVIPFPMPQFLNIPEIIIQTNTIEKEIIPTHIKELLKNTASGNIDCPICMLSVTPSNFKITDCGHIFCNNCLDHWLKTNDYNETKNDDCPTCRKKL